MNNMTELSRELNREITSYNNTYTSITGFPCKYGGESDSTCIGYIYISRVF